jgi:hypothetical protein
LDLLPIGEGSFFPPRKQNKQGLHKVETLIQDCLKHSNLSHKETEDRNLYKRSGLEEVMAQKRDLSINKFTIERRRGRATTVPHATV